MQSTSCALALNNYAAPTDGRSEQFNLSFLAKMKICAMHQSSLTQNNPSAHPPKHSSTFIAWKSTSCALALNNYAAPTDGRSKQCDIWAEGFLLCCERFPTNVGTLKDFSYGLRINADPNATGIAKQSNYELVNTYMGRQRHKCGPTGDPMVQFGPGPPKNLLTLYGVSLSFADLHF
ncbi:hypothetical protein ACH5RR_010756 [Cinchona calisaya]|uniref:Uncharacterized protein n=1 Tax=Cinchona calisaya TaxID=153742 RepID=A0ABD3AJU3_9GENT